VAVTNFVPEIWARVILAALKANLVFGGPGCANNDYEGEISGPGASVNITTFSDPTVGTYVEGSDITWGAPSDSGQTLNINQQKYIAFTVDDIARRQAAGDFQTYVEGRGAYQLALTEDEYIAGLYTTSGVNVLSNGANSSLTVGDEFNPGIAAGSPSSALYDEVVLPMSVKLDDNLVPDDGNRYLVVPPFAHAMLKRTPAFVSFGYDDTLLTGQLGTLDGFTVYKSQNAVKFDTTAGGSGATAYSAGYVVQGGHPMATTVAEQISNVESIRLQNQFADGVRALHVYGASMIRPYAVVVAGLARPVGI
jgi:hypothetical protein